MRLLFQNLQKRNLAYSGTLEISYGPRSGFPN
jgi:hypothetical protein